MLPSDTNAPMGGVKRYDLEGSECEIYARDGGEFVRHTDYASLTAEVSALREALENVLGFCATNQGPEASMAVDDARAALAKASVAKTGGET